MERIKEVRDRLGVRYSGIVVNCFVVTLFTEVFTDDMMQCLGFSLKYFR